MTDVSQETCSACGKPLGWGTLLDFQPDVPPAVIKLGIPPEDWQRFAARYLCPVCAEATSRADGFNPFELEDSCDADD
jgi:endogenous inhibitor of DNA gyrase (YacG/DUF329 family)